jgi:hypothetical protein
MTDDDETGDARANIGEFSVLDDSGLLTVLSLLEAKELARLGQTCRVMAVFCDHDPLWKDLLLRERKGNWSWQRSFRDTYVLNKFPTAVAHRPFPVRGLYSDLLNKSWLCANAKFNRNWIGVDTIPRERFDELSVEDFVRKYEAPNKPCIITGAMKNWPLYQKLEEWLEKEKDTVFKVGAVRMPLGEYRKYSRECHDEDPLYLFDKHFAEKCPELPEMYQIPPYFAPERDLFGLMGEEERPDYRWLIAGSACSGSAFHIDPNGTSAWNAVFSGSKKWILAPKSMQVPGVYPNATFGEVATTVSVRKKRFLFLIYLFIYLFILRL